MKCLASIMYDSVILCDELIQPYNEEKIFNEKKATCKTQNFYILLIFLLITIGLLLAAAIYCYLIKILFIIPQKNKNKPELII